MQIGDVSDRSGLSVKTIRYYEDIGLIRPFRGPNGYRDFSESDVHKLAFLARARSLGFAIADCRALLALYEDRQRASADVKRGGGGAPRASRAQGLTSLDEVSRVVDLTGRIGG